MTRKQWFLLLAIIMAALLLSGCGVNREGVDIASTPPEGLWQSLVVWPMAKALIWLDSLLQRVGISYHWGFAIILFTVVIKILTLPLTITQVRGMQAQKDLQPKIQALQKKYGKDREKISQEQMKLYKEAGVNPLSGCLPLVVQMPILFGLYSALIALGPHLVNTRFFWIPDLGFPEYTKGLSWIPENFQAGNYGVLAAYLVLPVLLVVTQFVMQKWMTPSTPDTGGQAGGMTKQVGLMMTFMFGFFTLQVPAGLTLYWVTSNLLQMFQQWFITNERYGLAKPSSAPAASSTEIIATAQEGSATAEVVTSTNGTDPQEKTGTSKQGKRRRAKRR